MKKKFLVLFTLLTLPLLLNAQDSDPAMVKKMLEQADDMGRKFVAKDYKAFLKYSHPAVIESMGGYTKMYDRTIEDLKALDKQEIKFIAITFGVPSKIITVGDERQAVIPELIQMQIPGGKLTTTASMLAISTDKGVNWYFADTGGTNLELMKNLIPSLSDDLVIPEPQDPSFEEDVKTE